MHETKAASAEQPDWEGTAAADDADGVATVAIDLGTFLRLHPPMVMADRLGNAHVLHQSSVSGYVHTIYYAGAGNCQKETIESDMAQPYLSENRGQVTVEGRRITPRLMEISTNQVPEKRRGFFKKLFSFHEEE